MIKKLSQKNKPRYNLGVIVRETGIKPDTIRAWERRYGIPKPHRSESGHRLYSDSDIETIKWLLNRQAEGMRISKAVELWKTKDTEGGLGENPKKQNQSKISFSELSSLKEKWVNACLNYDENRAEQILAQAFAFYPLETVCSEVIQKGLGMIGEKWYQNQISVQQEHFASALVMRKINTMISSAPNPTKNERFIVCCPPGELHDLPALIDTLIIRYLGWPVIYLGADVPQEHLLEVIDSVSADILITTPMQLTTAANYLDIANALKSSQLRLGYHGYIFTQLPDLCKRTPGFHLGNDFHGVIQTIGELINSDSGVLNIINNAPTTQNIVSEFSEKQFAIHAIVKNKISHFNLNHDHIENALTFLSKNLLAALKFNNLDFLKFELDYSRKLLSHRNYKDECFQNYLYTYKEALALNLDDAGMITNWLSKYLSELQESNKD